jgi:serine/threonine protein kinase
MNQEELGEKYSSDGYIPSKLIGYGQFSLVFHPPLPAPDRCLSPELSVAIRKNPSAFVSLVTTQGQYESKIRASTKLLRQLSAQKPSLSKSIVFPFPFSNNEDFLLLEDSDIQTLVQNHHAVRKKVEYEKLWEGKSLVQLIYPYAGKPLEQFYKNPVNTPSWTDFFQAMSEIARFVADLHQEGYVHGDLSPNNLLYEQNGRVAVVDWNMLTTAENFLQQRKGRRRVGCWSPEHFSLTTSRMKQLDPDQHWLIYAEELQKYIDRLLHFSFSNKLSSEETSIRKYFEPYTANREHPAFHAMYDEMKTLMQAQPSLIARYHDIRYLMDTIAKCVCSIFQGRSEAQQNRYNLFIALYLVQNLPDRKVYLTDPDALFDRLLFILESCQTSEREEKQLPGSVPQEEALLKLLQTK